MTEPATSAALFPPPSPMSSQSDLSLKGADSPVRALLSPPRSSSPNDEYAVTGEELPPLQAAPGDPDGLDPLGGEDEDLDPNSFDLVMPAEQNGTTTGKYKLETRSELLFSNRHLQTIFDDSTQLHRFSNFLYQHRPASVPLLVYFLEALKALRAIDYSNAVLRKLGPLANFEFTHEFFQAQPTVNEELQAKAQSAFDTLAQEDLPMYITHVWIQTVSVSIRRRIMGIPCHASEGLAEVFCLTDPSRHDNPIVFMSEEFNRTTQYGLDYVIGRNCRFLQGPNTNPFSIRRIREKLDAGVEHYETFLNYRRDGSPFMNLVMIAPLYDSRGVIRYFIGAQIDVSGLAMGCYDFEALKRLVDEETPERPSLPLDPRSSDEFTQLAKILGPDELDVVQDHGGGMHRLPLQDEAAGLRYDEKIAFSKPNNDNSRSHTHHRRYGSKNRVVLGDSISDSQLNGDQMKDESYRQPPRPPSGTGISPAIQRNGRLTGVYENYLLVRPYPSLRILFTSPSMRVPGILQSPLLDRIGGSTQMRDQLVQALANGQSVTAKVKWLNTSHRVARYESRPPKKKMQYNHPLEAHLENDDDSDSIPIPESRGRSRWLHCTPLVGSNGKVGVWMIVIVDDESDPNNLNAQRGHVTIQAPPNRPSTSMSERGVGIEEMKKTKLNSDARFRIRPRRSSETLGSRPTPPTMASIENDDASATNSIHRKHSLSVLRSPKPSLKTVSVPARFFSAAALSRAASTANPHNGTVTPLFSSGQERHQKHDSRDSTGSAVAAVRVETPVSLSWPLPPDHSAKSRRKREHSSHLHATIREISPERQNTWGYDENEETQSIKSQTSAFTVRIEEE